VTIYVLACIRYVYIRAWCERREDSIPPGSYTRKNGRHADGEREERERVGGEGEREVEKCDEECTKYREEEGRENDVTQLEG